MTARWLTADVFDGLATLDDGSVDLVVTSPPFLALRSYLPADHPDKGKEIGSESTPAEFLDVLLDVSAELRRVLAPHGSIAIELGDTYAGSGGAGGDYAEDGWREGQPVYAQRSTGDSRRGADARNLANNSRGTKAGGDWPLAKSKTLIPELYRIALAYGVNPLTGTESPAGRWRVRNVVTWCRPNPPVGALGDKWRPATSDVVVACLSGKRYWDDLATRKDTPRVERPRNRQSEPAMQRDGSWDTFPNVEVTGGAPLLDYWEIPPGGYPGSHYAVYPQELVVPLVKAMGPQKVCRTCGEPSRPIIETTPDYDSKRSGKDIYAETGPRDRATGMHGGTRPPTLISSERVTTGWTDCGHDDYRVGRVLDPFAGSGTTLAVAVGHGLDAIGIDLDERNLELARERVGPFFFEEVVGGVG